MVIGQSARRVCLGLILSATFSISGCSSTPRVADVERFERNNDLDGLLDAWSKADNESVRIAIVQALAQHRGDDRAKRIVVDQATNASSEPLKLAALRALEKFEGPEPAAALFAALDDAFPSVRALAQSLLAPRAKEIANTLRSELTSSPSLLVRTACARLLESVARSDATMRSGIEDSLMERAIRDEAPQVREAAVIALGGLGVVRARRQMLDLARTDADSSVRMSAERAVSKLGEDGQAKAIVAVLPLKNETGLNDPEITRFGEQVSEYISARLSAGKVCDVVDPEKVEKAIAELLKVGEVMYDGDAPNAPAIGRFKIANQLVYGTLQRQGKNFTLVLHRMEISTLAQVPGGSVTVQGYRADLDQLKVRATDQLLASFR